MKANRKPVPAALQREIEKQRRAAKREGKHGSSKSLRKLARRTAYAD